MITEDLLEQLAIDWFKDLGYECLYGPDIAPDTTTGERDSWQQVILTRRLRSALQRLNPTMPPQVLDDALHRSLHPAHPTLLLNNRDFHRMLTDGVTVDVSADDHT